MPDIKEYSSNYERVERSWREKFLQMDHAELMRKFSLSGDDKALYIPYFSQKIRLDRTDGCVTNQTHPDWPLSFHTRVGLYNAFFYACKAPAASHRLVPFRELERVYPFERAYEKTILAPLAETFSGRSDQLRAAAESLGGVRMEQGDAGYILPVFPFLQMAILFWDADEEFPASANMLFDSRINDFMHEENIVGVASDALTYLTLAASLPVSGGF